MSRRIIHKFDTEDLKAPVILQYDDSTGTLYANGKSLSGGGGGGADSVVTDPTGNQIITGAYNFTITNAFNYDASQFPGGSSSLYAITIGTPEANVDPSIQQWWTPASTLFTSHASASVGFDQAIAVEASGDLTPFGGVNGIGIITAGHPTTDQVGGLVAGIKSQVLAIGTFNSGQLIGVWGQIQSGGKATVASSAFYASGAAPGNSTELNGLLVDILAGATNNYAVHISNQGTGSGNYALKVDGGKSDLGPQATTVGSLVTKDSSFGSFDPTSQYKVVIQGDDTSIGGFEALGIYTSSNNSGHNELDFLTSRGTNASPTAVQTGDQLMSIATPAVYGTAWTSTMNQVELFGEVYDASQHAGWLQFYIISDKFGDPLNPPNFSTMFALAGDGNSIIGPHVAEAGSGVGSTLAADADSTLTIENKLTIGTGQGITTHNIRSGPNQSTTDLTQWQAANKLVLTKIKSDGNLVITNMATSDPHVVGQLYNVAGVVHISAG